MKDYLAVSRRVAAVAGHTGEEATARKALHEEAPATRAAALGALARMGALTADDLGLGLTDAAFDVRRRACDLAGRHGFSQLCGALITALDDVDNSVVEAACYALGELGEPQSVRALAATATSHQDLLCREAAVAALGAIGHADGLPAVLSALRDKPAIRRRAVVALAAFDGPRVDDALAAAAQDRDWQVRQVAEDLLGLR